MKASNQILVFVLTACLCSFSAAGQRLSQRKAYEVSAAQDKQGRLIAAWLEARANKKVGEYHQNNRIIIALSSDNGKTWGQRQVLDDTTFVAYSNPCLATDHEGNTYLAFMRVGREYYTGSIPIYKLSRGSNQFKPFSDEVKSDRMFLDKPGIVCSETGKIDLVYAAYREGFKRSDIIYQQYSLNTSAWTAPILIAGEEGKMYMAPAIIRSKSGSVGISMGTIRKGTLWYSYNHGDGTMFCAPRLVASGAADYSMTEMIESDTGRKAIYWQFPHSFGQVCLSFLDSASVSWTKPLVIAGHGALCSAAFDGKNNLWLLYDEQLNGLCYLKTATIKAGSTELSGITGISGPSLRDPSDYIGAFQKILITKDGKIHCFWIDWSNGGSVLKHSILSNKHLI